MNDLERQLNLFNQTLTSINEKGKPVDVGIKYYEKSNFRITVNGKEVDDTIGNAIVTYYHHSKAKVSYQGNEIFLHGSFKDSSNNPASIYFHVDGEIYKMDFKK